VPLQVHLPASVIVNDLDVFGSFGGPAEADAPLIVDANAVLALPVAFQCFKPGSFR
jgi:hypothetical protein